MQGVNIEDVLARFILDPNRFSSTKNEVKFRAFLPNPMGELSVFVVSKWDEEKIWQVGKKYVANPLGKTLKARGDIKVSVVVEHGLAVDKDDIPPGHANVLGWPDKSEQKITAMKLAKASRLVITPPKFQA